MQHLYELSPSLYDEYMSTAAESRNFERVFSTVKEWEGKRVLDLCCGTALLARNWLQGRDVRYVGVDKNGAFAAFAQERLAGDERFSLVVEDAVDARVGGKFDVVVLTSAYHHIEDKRKVLFLRNAARHLKKDGVVVVYEKFIRHYQTAAEAADAGMEFYKERILQMMRGEKLTQVQLFALYNELYLTAVRKEEYKVPLARFLGDAAQAGLQVVKKECLWPLGQDAGDWLLVLRPAYSRKTRCTPTSVMAASSARK